MDFGPKRVTPVPIRPISATRRNNPHPSNVGPIMCFLCTLYTVICIQTVLRDWYSLNILLCFSLFYTESELMLQMLQAGYDNSEDVRLTKVSTVTSYYNYLTASIPGTRYCTTT